jgi:hypothetical protein
MDKIPSVGRIVHYIAYGTPGGEYPSGAHRAAIITEIPPLGPPNPEPTISLCILNPTGMFFNTAVLFDPTASKPGTWHWPEYVS